MPSYPPKKGVCSITGCPNTDTQWHHIISQNRIKSKGLDPKLFDDPGNLVEYCQYHHDQTTASLAWKHFEKEKKKGKKKGKSKPNIGLEYKKKHKQKLAAKKGKKLKEVVCAKCYHVGHESKDCRARNFRDPNHILVKMEISGLPIK